MIPGRKVRVGGLRGHDGAVCSEGIHRAEAVPQDQWEKSGRCQVEGVRDSSV